MLIISRSLFTIFEGCSSLCFSTQVTVCSTLILFSTFSPPTNSHYSLSLPCSSGPCSSWTSSQTHPMLGSFSSETPSTCPLKHERNDGVRKSQQAFGNSWLSWLLRSSSNDRIRYTHVDLLSFSLEYIILLSIRCHKSEIRILSSSSSRLSFTVLFLFPLTSFHKKWLNRE